MDCNSTVNSPPPSLSSPSHLSLFLSLSGQTTFTQLLLSTPGGPSLADALSSWYFDNEAVQDISDCTGWQCTAACGVDLQTGLPCNMGTPNCSPLTLQTDPGASTSSEASPPPPPVAPPVVQETESSETSGHWDAVGQNQQKPSPVTAVTQAQPGEGVTTEEPGSVATSEAALSSSQTANLRAMQSNYKRATTLCGFCGNGNGGG